LLWYYYYYIIIGIIIIILILLHALYHIQYGQSKAFRGNDAMTEEVLNNNYTSCDGHECNNKILVIGQNLVYLPADLLS
jgi:FtsZ-interacting cell division protein ZipA